MEHIKLHQPKVDPAKLQVLLFEYFKSPSKTHEFEEYFHGINYPKYEFWDKVAHKTPPQGYSREEAWATAHMVRKFRSSTTPVVAPTGESFRFYKLPEYEKKLHDIDLKIAGTSLLSRLQNDEKQRYLTRGILEESIASSQLEGASTTRKYAKKMISENKKPKSISEWMIHNNYIVLKAIEEEYKEQELSIELIREIHSRLTINTLEDGEVGRLRRDDDEIVVQYGNKIAYEAPDMEFVNEQLERLVEFANDDSSFLHPVIKASVLHFWIGYLHPFVDGNGRLARSIFYWYLLKHEYWGMAYIPISLIIKKAKALYTYAFIHAEQDDFDLTYFIDYSIERVKKAITEFDQYVESLQEKNRLIDNKLRQYLVLNDRQRQIVNYITTDSTNYVTEQSYQMLSGISRGTARADLKQLELANLLYREKSGKAYRYYASSVLLEAASGKNVSHPGLPQETPAPLVATKDRQLTIFD